MILFEFDSIFVLICTDHEYCPKEVAASEQLIFFQSTQLTEKRFIMANSYSIILNNITSSSLPPKINRVNLSFGQQKYGIVGRNGIGKTTLLKLVLGDIEPNSGSIQRIGSISYVPQLHASFIDSNTTIADILGISDILKSITNVNNGSCKEHDFEIIGSNWDIESRAEHALAHFNLNNIEFNSPFNNFSGGQKTKVLLSKTLIFPTDFILFDEPTNNLDKESRDILYHYIVNSTKGIIAISHDRTLLNKMDNIIEITTNNINTYGGNFEHFKAQKKINLQALQQDYKNAKSAINKTKLSIQKSQEKHEQRQSKGKSLRKKNSQSKIILDSMKSRSEKSQSKMFIKEERLINNAQSTLSNIKEKIEANSVSHIALDKTYIPKNKIVLSIDNISFNYKHEKRLIHNFNLRIVGPDRVAITGRNGTGKSTLIQIILENLKPNKGNITLGIQHFTYLDQSVGFLNPAISIVDNFLHLNPESKIFDAYTALSWFNFRNQDAEKIVGQLSGGEKMRAGLAVVLMSKNPPQLIILDEPTNHLDFETIEAIEQALKMYQGAILAISHDEVFLKNIDINRYISIE